MRNLAWRFPAKKKTDYVIRAIFFWEIKPLPPHLKQNNCFKPSRFRVKNFTLPTFPWTVQYKIIDDEPDQLLFRFPAASVKGGFWVAILFRGILQLILENRAILSHLSKDIDPFDIVVLLFLSGFFWWGYCRWHSGSLGFRNVISTNVISSVELVHRSAHRTRRSRRSQTTNNQPSCVVNTATTKLPVTFLTELETSRQVAGPLQHQLRTMGFSPAHTED